MADTRVPKFRVGKVINPTELRFLIDLSELEYINNSLLLAKECLPDEHVGLTHQSGRSLMVLALAFNEYLKNERVKSARTK